jgi:hypothetical protein
MSHPGATSFEIPRHECLDLIRGEPVGRICILENGVPLAFPVNYKVTVEGNDLGIVMRTAPETTIGHSHGAASLEVDRIDLDAGRAWSVIVRGQLRPLLGEPGPVDPEPILRTGRTRWMMLDVSAVSGRRFVVRRDGDFAVEWQMERT